ncbi:MAG: Rieske (2Fe-2S) protein [Nostocoides sp.]
MTNPLTRRTALVTVGAAAAASTSVAGCSADASGGSAGSGDAGGSGPVEISASEVPVDGGTFIAAAHVVVTQPTAGTYKAFSSICTHQQCEMTQIVDGQIVCACHGSAFSIEDGSVQQGPATSGLDARSVSDASGTLTIT